MVFHLTHGKTWIKTYEDAAALNSTSLRWLSARYSSDLLALLGRMLSTKPGQRPTAEEIKEETDKNERRKKPMLISANQLDDFIGQVGQMVALLPRKSYQFKGKTITVEQWTGRLSERIKGLRKQARDSDKEIRVGDLIANLSGLLMRLQDPMTGEDLAKSCSLLKNIEEMAHIEDKL